MGNRIFGLLLICMYLLIGVSQGQNRIPFDNMPRWIEEHIVFPQEAMSYGVEQFCISATWDGQVFLTSRPYTLDPACEKAIVEAVKAAPRCEFTGSAPEDIYKYISIDFARGNGSPSVGRHSIPLFAHESSGAFNGRRDFMAWANGKYKIPKGLEKCDYADTLTVRYRIDGEGRMADVRIFDCSVPEVAASLKKLLLASPRWRPVLTENLTPVCITLEDSWIVRFVNRKPQFELYDEPVYRNDAPAPGDSSIVVMNPEVPASCRDGAFHRLLFGQLPKTDTTVLCCRFIVEPDGTTSGIEVQTRNTEIAERIAAFISQTNWQPATQQGTPVRSQYTRTITRRPAKGYRKESHADFGRDYIYLQTPPYARNRVYLQSDGTYAVFPFDDQGRFSRNEYQHQQTRAARQSPAKSRHVREDYNRQLKKRYADK